MKLTPKRAKISAVILIIMIIGGLLGWNYNRTAPARAANDSAVIRAGADVSTVVGTDSVGTTGVVAVTAPFRNDSPYPVTLNSLILPYAAQLVWQGEAMTVQPGETGYPLVDVPASCLAGLPAAGSGPVRSTPPSRSAAQNQLPTIYLKVNTVDGKTHGITLGANGALEVAAFNCGQVSSED